MVKGSSTSKLSPRSFCLHGSEPSPVAAEQQIISLLIVRLFQALGIEYQERMGYRQE